MKKKILYIAVIAICLSMVAGGSLAYFTAEDTARNVITSDGIAITVEEWQETADGLIPYPDQPIAVMPGGTVSKIVTVRNQDARSYIRIKLQLILKDAAGNETELTSETMQKLLHLAMNDQDWTEKDGWWYYGSSVKTGEVTEPLMTGVLFDGTNITNEYQKCTLEINVYAQAVQAANNGETVLDAAGWPED